MDGSIHKATKQNEDMKETSVHRKADDLQSQSYFAFNDTTRSWESKTVTPDAKSVAGASGITRLALYSWNIDFMLPFAKARMAAALVTLRSLASQLPSTTAVVIYLQECVESDLRTISELPWIRDSFHITDLDTWKWASGHYGTTTLVDRRLPITSCFRVHYEKTRMQRDAFFVDVLMGANQDKTIRLCNTHLESLVSEPPFRPSQMKLVAKYMHEKNVHGAVAAGDFNAIQEFDKTLHSDNDLRDAYLELGGQEDSDAGYTWGQQAATQSRDRFGCSRMDKVYFGGGLELRSFERFGAGVELEDNRQREHLVTRGFDKPWITDHLGVKAEVDIV
ncbi:Endonuclease/exonuclease/phosphatase [Xylariales sp. AK1849]|nr:Endonuclease/exonuclease/phosphatase [Xylariales sp. AK1849]